LTSARAHTSDAEAQRRGRLLIFNAHHLGELYMEHLAATQYREGTLTKAVESQTAKLPSATFLWAAFGSIAASLALQMMGKKEESLFVGQWAPTFLLLGIYNKFVKVVGSE
jgi:hypothetical protein